MLEQGMVAMQVQMSELVGALSRQQLVQLKAGPQRGAMQWPEGVTLPSDSQILVPGDGDCLWHALAVCKAGPEAVTKLPGLGKTLKQEYLEWLSQHASEAAQLWGCGEEAIPSIVHAWQNDWADGRALLLASHLEGVSILLFNRPDQKIEVFHAGGNPALTGGVWAAVFSGSHYDALKTPGPEDIQRVRSTIPLVPWKHSARQPLRGGSYSYSHLTRVGISRKRHLLQRHKERRQRRDEKRGEQGKDMVEPQPQTPTGQGIMTWNVGGMRTALQEIRVRLVEQRPNILALQEVRVSREHQGALQQALKRDGYSVLWGQPTEWGKTKNGQMRLMIGETPGVAFIYAESMKIAPWTPHTAAARELMQQGRLLMAMMEVAPNQHVLMMNVYMPSGNNQQRARQEMKAILLRELCSQDRDEVIMMGDYNEEIMQSDMLAKLQCQRGWRVPQLVDPQLAPYPGTLQQDTHRWIDGIILGPKIMVEATHQVALPVKPWRHAPVWMPFGPTIDASPTVYFPPKIQQIIPTDEKMDWGGLLDAMKRVTSDSGMTPAECIEVAWTMWQGGSEGIPKTQNQIDSPEVGATPGEGGAGCSE